jgi:hypothetical protein
MDTVMRLIQVIYWHNFVTRRRRKGRIYTYKKQEVRINEEYVNKIMYFLFNLEVLWLHKGWQS